MRKWRLWERCGMKLVWNRVKVETLCLQSQKLKEMCKMTRSQWATKEVLWLPLLFFRLEEINVLAVNPWVSLCFVLFLYVSVSNNRSVLALDCNMKSVASLFASVSLTNPCPPSLAEVKSGLKNREIIPPQCSLLYQSHALLQILMMNGSFSALHRPSTLVLLFGNDFI